MLEKQILPKGDKAMDEVTKYKGYDIKVVADDCNDSPRDWDNLGTMLCFHKKYNLGDKTDLKSEDFNGWDEIETYLKNDLKAVIILPLYLYDHSGITIATSPFSCPWDSGRVGLIYVTKEAIMKNFMVKKWSKKLIDRSVKILEAEVKTYDQYLTGDVWGYIIKKDGEDIDDGSCFGFYGQEDCLKEAKSTVDSEIEFQRKKKIKKTKALITNHVPLLARA